MLFPQKIQIRALGQIGIHYLEYRKVASSNTSRLEAHAAFFRLLVYCDILTKVDFLINNAH